MLATSSYTYESALKSAVNVNWRLEDIIGGDKKLDFAKQFLPETLARTQEIQGLSDREKHLLNQIRGNSYLHIFGLVEAFIIPTVMDRVREVGFTDITATEALLHFAEEESKHIRLFDQFAREFEMGFGSRCDGIGPIATIAEAVLQHSPLGVMLIILYIEWMTQYHYLESVRNNYVENLDPQFCSLLRHHWLEEAQHACLDTLMVQKLVDMQGAAIVEQGVTDFFKLIDFLNNGLMAQVKLDIDSLEHAIGRTLSEAQRQEIQSVQEKSYQWTFIGSGLTHRNFIRTFNEISPSDSDRLAEVAQCYC